MYLDRKTFSDKILAGQKIITGIFGTTLDKETKIFLKKTVPGGIILFSRNIQTKDQLKRLNSDILNFYNELELPTPFISVDQEGGTVARMKEPEFKELPSIDSISSVKESTDHAKKMSALLKECHFNMNMAPVLDCATLMKNSIMKSRSFPGSVENVAELGAAMSLEYMKNGIIPVGKHFPGIGKTDLDSHLTLPVYEENINFMEQNDLVPFIKAIESNIPALMFSHILYRDLDPEWPASLSREVCRNLLRKKLGFNGISMTDDLDMKAITSDIETSVKRIKEADQDIALICHSLENVETVFNYFLKELKKGEIDILKSIDRIFRVKNNFLYER